MEKSNTKKGFVIELPKEAFKKMPLRTGDWLVVRLLNGKEVTLEKPQKDYWDETFAWGKKFSRNQKIKSKDVLEAIDDLRAGK